MPLKPCEMSLKCELCSEDAYFCDLVPVSGVKGANHPGENAYRFQPLCFLHGLDRKRENTARVSEILICFRQALARLDRGRVSGEMICPECNRKYHNHKGDQDHPYMTVLCDGSVVKL